MTIDRPSVRPENPNFGSGPCSKRPGWSLAALDAALVGRSHRSKPGKARLAEVIERTRRTLAIPDDYRIGIVPGSDTGAMEMAMWSLLGARGVDVFAWESFGKGWVTDVTSELRLDDLRAFEADYGRLPDLGQADWDRDVIFTWNGTTSGVMVPDGDWIAADRRGLAICDATSAVYAMSLPWDRLDVATWSWQKVLGGEAAHGMLVLSPRAVERLRSHTPPWPMPKLFRLAKKGSVLEGIFEGSTINTPSMLCVEDALDALRWVEGIGGVEGTIARSVANLEALAGWVESTDWVEFLAVSPATRSRTSICLRIVEPRFAALPLAEQSAAVKGLVGRLDDEGVAYDIGSYRDAPPGLRVWGGATVERADLEALTPWLDWSFAELAAELA